MTGQQQIAGVALPPPHTAAEAGQQQQRVLISDDSPSCSFTFASNLGDGFFWEGDADLERIAATFAARNGDLLDNPRSRDDGQHTSLECAGASPEAAALQPTLTGDEGLSTPLPAPRVPPLQGGYGAWHSVPRGSGAIATVASPSPATAAESRDEDSAARPAVQLGQSSGGGPPAVRSLASLPSLFNWHRR